MGEKLTAILLADCRCGGTALRDTLGGHPDLRHDPGEPLDPNCGDGPRYYDEPHSRATWERFVEGYFDAHDLWHLQRYQIRTRSHGWNVIKEVPGLRIIDLRREDKVEQFASWKFAMATNHWHSRPQSPPQLRWNQDDCDHWCYVWQRKRQFTSHMFDGVPSLSITFEDLVDDFGGTVYRCQQFLGLEPLPLEPAMQRLPPVDYAAVFDGWPR